MNSYFQTLKDFESNEFGFAFETRCQRGFGFFFIFFQVNLNKILFSLEQKFSNFNLKNLFGVTYVLKKKSRKKN